MRIVPLMMHWFTGTRFSHQAKAMAYLVAMYINSRCPHIWKTKELEGCAAKIRVYCMDAVQQEEEVAGVAREEMVRLVTKLQLYA